VEFPDAEAVWCINLDARPDRWEVMQKRLAAAGIEAARFRGWTPQEAEPELVRRPFPMPLRPHTLRIVACSLAHMAVWRRALAEGRRAIVVFEDDVVFADGFRAALAGMLAAQRPDFFSFDALPAPMDFAGPGFAVHELPRRFHCAGGYYLTESFMRSCLEIYEASELFTNHERLLSIASRSARALTCTPRLCMQDWFLDEHRSDIQPDEHVQTLRGLARNYMRRYGAWYRQALAEAQSDISSRRSTGDGVGAPERK
jgi:GR25 family glycosyltransferase involved in LPS biosynthesis